MLKLSSESVAERTGGVAPLGWLQPVTILIDLALCEYDVMWAPAGHPHAVFPTTFEELMRTTKAQAMTAAKD